MKKINIYTILLAPALLLVVSMGSCRKDPVVGGTATQSLAGEWWVKIDGGTGEFGNQYYNLSTYNTASNRPDSIWIDDDNNAKSFWDVKGKVACSTASKTFGSNNISNVDYQSSFNIKNGKVIQNGGHASGTGDKVDSITFQISFSDEDPTLFHTVSGYKRTGFSQDDH